MDPKASATSWTWNRRRFRSVWIRGRQSIGQAARKSLTLLLPTRSHSTFSPGEFRGADLHILLLWSSRSVALSAEFPIPASAMLIPASPHASNPFRAPTCLTQVHPQGLHKRIIEETGGKGQGKSGGRPCGSGWGATGRGRCVARGSSLVARPNPRIQRIPRLTFSPFRLPLSRVSCISRLTSSLAVLTTLLTSSAVRWFVLRRGAWRINTRKLTRENWGLSRMAVA